MKREGEKRCDSKVTYILDAKEIEQAILNQGPLVMSWWSRSFYSKDLKWLDNERKIRILKSSDRGGTTCMILKNA